MRYYELFAKAGTDQPAIALALHAMTDLPIVALMVGNDGQRQRVAHVMVKSAEDSFIDADSARSLVEIMTGTGVDPNGDQKWEVRGITPEILLNWSNGKRLPVITKALASQAKQQAADIVATLGIQSH